MQVPLPRGRATARRFVLLPLLALALAPQARAGGIRILEPTGTKNYATLQAAVDAAVEGDVILVGAGTYPGVAIDGKSLSIHAVPPGSATLSARIPPFASTSVRNLAAGQSVTLRGFTLLGREFSAQPGLAINACAGAVRIEGCQIQGGDASPGLFECSTTPGGNGVVVTGSAGVVLSACGIEGGSAGQQDPNVHNCPGPRGGDALRVSASTLLVESTTMRGGKGQWAKNAPAGPGGCGVVVDPLSSVWFSASSMLGGAGGDHYFCGGQGSGGAGLQVSGATAHLLQVTLAGGPGGHGAFPNNNQPCAGSSGPATVGATIVPHPGNARNVSSLQRVLSEGATWRLTVAAPVGDAVHLLGARVAGFRLALLGHGALLVPTPSLLPFAPWFVQGQPQPPFVVPPVAAGTLYRHTYHQGLTFDPSGGGWLGGPLELVALSRTSPPDCNGNGVNDFVEVLEGTVPDVNNDLKPDGCP